MLVVSKKWLSFFAIIFLVDQMLLPMFHIGGAPFKVSYFILLLVFLIREDFDYKNQVFFQKTLKTMLFFLAIVFMSVLFFNSLIVDYQFSETVRMMLVFVLGLGSLKLGLLASDLPPKYLTGTLTGVMVLILLLVFVPEAVPFISKMWWKTNEQFQEMLNQNKLRPTPFGDGSGVRVNILFLGITLLFVHKIHEVNFKWIFWISVLIINIIMGSRNQFIVFLVYSFYFFFKNKDIKEVVSRLFLGVMGLVILFPFFIQLTSKSTVFTHTLERIGGVFSMFGDDVSDKNDALSRPLLMFESFLNRFLESPIIGSSFDVTNITPFNYLHFHNDWLLLLATTGVLGFIVYATLVHRIYRNLGLVAIFPFFLPGLTNSFIWAIPSYLVYFFILGYSSILKEKNKFVPNQ